MRNSNVGGMSYKAPPSALPQGRGSLRSSREQAWWLTVPEGCQQGEAWMARTLKGMPLPAHSLWPFFSSCLSSLVSLSL